MSVIVDRTRQETAPALLAWHAEETNRLLKVSVDVLFESLDLLIAATDEERVGEFFGPFLNALQEAADQFDHLYHAATGKMNA